MLVGAITAPYAIVVDSVSFAVSALFLGRIRKREPRPEPTAAPSMRRELMEGLRYVLGDPRWRAITLYVSTFNFFSSVAFALYVVYAVRNLGLTPGELGLVLGLGNLGWLLGAVVVRRLSGRLGIGLTLVLAAFIGGAATLLIPLAPVSYAIPFLVTSGVLTAFGIVIYNVTAISLIQTLTPDRLLGRANASRRWIVWGTIPLGSLVGGVLSTVIGVRPTLFVGTIGVSLCFLFLLARPLRSITTLPDQDGEPVPLVDDVALGLEGQSAEA